MGKAMPRLAAASLCLLSLSGCVSTSEPGPAFPASNSPGLHQPGSANPSGSPGAAGFPQATKETGAWGGFVSAVTDNPLARSIKSTGQKTFETLSPKSQAESEYDPVSLNNPTPKPNAAMYVSMAHVHETSNNLDAAANSYEKALELDKKFVPAMVGLGHVRFRQQRHDDAYRLFTESRKIEPHNLEAMLGQAHYQDTRENMQEATRLYTEATQRHPDSAAAWNDLGLCLARQGRLPESQQTLQRAVQLEPTNVLYRNNIATVLVELKRYDEALVHLQQAHGQAAGHYNLGFLLHRRGDEQAAAEQFNMALRVDPSFQPARQWLEKLNNSQGNSQRAGRPPMGRSAVLLPGPYGGVMPLLVKNAEQHDGLLAPPDFDSLPGGRPSAVVAQTEAAERKQDPTVQAEAEQSELAESQLGKAESTDHVMKVAAAENAEEAEIGSAPSPPEEPQLVTVRRKHVNHAYEAETERHPAENVVEPPLPGDGSSERDSSRSAKLMQPRMVSGIADTGDVNANPASELPTSVAQLRLVGEEDFQLEPPPAGHGSDEQGASAAAEESGEPYYEPASDAEQYRANGNAENAFPKRPISLYDSLAPVAEEKSAGTSSENLDPAERHGWKKVKVNWSGE